MQAPSGLVYTTQRAKLLVAHEHALSSNRKGALNLPERPSVLLAAMERLKLENEPAAQLELSRIVGRAGVGVKLA